MSELLPDSISRLVQKLQVVQFYRRNIPIQLPKFAVYAILEKPVFDRFIYRDKRRIGIIKLDRYVIPVIEPLRGDLKDEPNYVVVISHNKGNRFGVFGYPADDVVENVELPFYHRAVKQIVRDFV